MAVRKDTLFERFLAPIVKTFLIDQAALRRFYESIDWEHAAASLTNPTVAYPPYYKNQNFHSIEGGYLAITAAVSYDPITQYALPPNEIWVRQELLASIRCKPSRILDLGCGTGSTTLLLKQAFPTAEVAGMDLSPYMLVVARHKSTQAGLPIQWHHGKAEKTGFLSASFDLITVCLLFHETPPAIAKAILRECYRLLTVGGEVLVLDGNQQMLRQAHWLTDIFEEPYIQDYAAESVDAWMGEAGFGAVQTRSVWGIHQVTRGVKPASSQTVDFSSNWETLPQGQWAGAGG